MQDVIKKLVDIDEQAKVFNEETNKEKEKLEVQIQEDAEKIYEKYMSDAKVEVETEKKKIDADGAAKFEQGEARRKEQAQVLKNKFDANADKWVEQIVESVISGQ
ncbi:MAG: hypothetical protein IJ932_04790 [Ruminococcus sp.]|nr:hypothetical protein [Ruminococcus sp.]